MKDSVHKALTYRSRFRLAKRAPDAKLEGNKVMATEHLSFRWPAPEEVSALT